MHLSTVERIALRGLVARDQAVYRDHIEPLRRDYAEFTGEVEARLGLPQGSIGTTHALMPDTYEIIETAQETAG